MPRKFGQPAGRAEGAPSVKPVRNAKKTPRSPHTNTTATGALTAPKMKFGGMQTGKLGGFSELGQNLDMKGLGSGYPLGDNNVNNMGHFHSREDGSIKRGRAGYGEKVKHIDKLSLEHIKHSALVMFTIQGQQMEGKVISRGPLGIRVHNSEGGVTNVFYQEIEEVKGTKKPDKSKAK